jgi:nucleotide-binding universal stress UspA family protein
MSQGPVLFAFDGSNHARAAIEKATAILKPGPAVVATAWGSFQAGAPAALLAMPGDMVQTAIETLDDAGREAAEVLVNEGLELVRAAGFEAEGRTVRSKGAFFASLIHLADEIDASAIVVGSRGRSSIAAAVLGSVSTGLLHHTHRPVIVARADDEA